MELTSLIIGLVSAEIFSTIAFEVPADHRPRRHGGDGADGEARPAFALALPYAPAKAEPELKAAFAQSLQESLGCRMCLNRHEFDCSRPVCGCLVSYDLLTNL